MVFGFKKKKEKDIEEIRKAVSKTERAVEMPVPEPLTPKPLPAEIERMTEEMELAPPPAKPQFAPLFVKVERYREVLESIEKIKSIISDMNSILAMRNEADKVGTDADVLLEKTLEQLNNVITELDREFVSPREAKPFIKAPESGLKSYVTDLEDEVKKLREHIQGFK